MAIDISPLYEVVQTHIYCDVYDGNYGFTPVDFSQLSVIFTLTNTAYLSSPVKLRKQGNTDAVITEVWTRQVEYLYQLDIFRQVSTDPEPALRGFAAPPFETEAFTVVDSINSARSRLSKRHDLHVLPLVDINFSLTNNASGIPCHRAFVTFSILGESLVKFSNNVPAVACVNPTIIPVRGDS